jgi:hypothetical protein
MTTHSPVVLRELSGHQLFVVRRNDEQHEMLEVGNDDDIQGTIRLFPDAFLAPNVLTCEGASEVGLVRGVDQFRTAQGEESITACGVALVDCGGGDADRCFRRAEAFRALGYRVAVLRDDDVKPTPAVEPAGTVIKWGDDCALEDDLFINLTADGVDRLIEYAIELHGEELVDEHIKTASQGQTDLETIRNDTEFGDYSVENRTFLGNASRIRKAGWFKSVTWMEAVGRNVVGPDLANANAEFKGTIEAIFEWASDGR